MIPKKKKNITNHLNQQVMLLSTIKELNNDQIKSLPSTPFQIIPAPGENKFIKVVAAVGVFNNSAGAYNTAKDASWNLSHQLNGGGQCTSLVWMGNSLDSTNIYNIDFPVPYAFTFLEGIFVEHLASNPKHSSLIINQPLYIGDTYAGIPDYTGGNADNKLKLTVYYVLVEV